MTVDTHHVGLLCTNGELSMWRMLQLQDKIQPAMNKTLSKYQDGKILS